MPKSGTIVVLDDDHEDRNIFRDLLSDLGMNNNVRWFDTADETLEFLCGTEPVFMIFSEVVLSGKSGLEFKREIDSDPVLRKKSIPFIFLSSAATQDDVNDAYLNMTVQGFFSKGNDYSSMRNMLRNIVDYWAHCRHPNTP